MIAVVDTFQDVVAWESHEIRQGRSGACRIGPDRRHAVSDLREYGGRIGSAIIPAVAVHRPLDARQFTDATQIRGRIQELLRCCAARRRSGRAAHGGAVSRGRGDLRQAGARPDRGDDRGRARLGPLNTLTADELTAATCRP